MGKLIDADALKKKFVAQRDKIEKEKKYGWEFTANGLNIAISITGIEAALNGIGWIPCTERLPEKSGLYIVTTPFSVTPVCSRYFNRRGERGEQSFWSGHPIDEVVAWAPMPEPYGGTR